MLFFVVVFRDIFVVASAFIDYMFNIWAVKCYILLMYVFFCLICHMSTVFLQNFFTATQIFPVKTKPKFNHSMYMKFAFPIVKHNDADIPPRVKCHKDNFPKASRSFLENPFHFLSDPLECSYTLSKGFTTATN